jgi:hypothetical protein
MKVLDVCVCVCVWVLSLAYWYVSLSACVFSSDLSPYRCDIRQLHSQPSATYCSRSYAYFAWHVLFHDNIPDARAELFREGMEDYEYLYIANGNRHPEVDVSRPVDSTAFSVGQSLTSWTQNAEALMVAR